MDHLNVNVKDQVNIKRSRAIPDSDLEQVRKIMQGNQRKKRKQNPFPTRLVLGCCLSLALLLTFHVYQKEILDGFSRINIKVSPVSSSEAKEVTKKEPVKQDVVSAKPVKKEEWTPEEIEIFQGLEKRREELDTREKNLNALSEELNKQKEALDVKLAEIDGVRQGISQALSLEVNKDEERLKKLVDVYSNMKPGLAAKLFEELDEKLAIEILAKMKKANAANILNFIEPAKARRLSEKYAGYIKK